jgi:glycosyltransferase involved in cell wall biosynthesis
MEDIRFVFIIPFYNVRNYIKDCVDSVLLQSYSNWVAICSDDHSTDGSSDQIPSDPRIIKRKNPQRVSALHNIYNAIVDHSMEFQDNDVICLLDGDDKLLHPFALDIVKELYEIHPQTLLTYGQHMNSRGRLGQCQPLAEWEFYSLRTRNFKASHLKTFKWKLYREFLDRDPDLNSYKDKNGNFYTMASDVAIMFPLMEIAGFERVAYNKHPIYWYRLYDGNDSALNRQQQWDFHQEISKKTPFVTRSRRLPIKLKIKMIINRLMR